jgi:hypothetical protein
MELLKIGEITVKPTKLNNTGAPYYSFSGSLDTNIYTDITSNKNWLDIGKTNYDYIFCREQIMGWTAAIGFSGLTQEEKEIASMTFSVSKSDRDSVHTEEEQMQFWQTLVSYSQSTREKRWKAAKSYISYFLTPPASWDIAQTTDQLSNDYIIYGIREKSTDQIDGLFDWINSTSSYSGGTGFNSKPYYSEEYKDNLIKILKDGIY